MTIKARVSSNQVSAKLLAAFPAQVLAGTGIRIDKSGLAYTFSWDVSSIATSISPSSSDYILGNDGTAFFKTTIANLLAGSIGTGTVTSVSVTTANGVSGSVATATSTPAITLALGDITPTSVTATGTISGTTLTSTVAIGTAPLTVTSTTLVSNLYGARSVLSDTVTVADAAGDTTTFPMLSGDATGSKAVLTDTGLTYNATTKALTTTTFIGALTGNATTSSSTSGNAATATALQNARTIGGVSFNGTANITVASATGGFTVSGGDLALGANNITMSGSLAATGTRVTKGWFTDIESTNAATIGGVAATGSGGYARATSPTFVTPILGTPTSGNLSNCTSYPIAQITGLGTNVGTFLATPSSANLAAALTDKTGTGVSVFANSPTLTTAILGSSTATTQSPNDNSTKIATTAYVDEAIISQNFKEAVKYASTAALPSIVYANGSSGVGATLTGVALAAISLDSSSPAVNDRVLIKNQASTFQNGIYTVTATGSGIAVFVLTRAVDADQSNEYVTGDSCLVTSGSTLSTTTWAYTGIDSPTMGTTGLTYVQVAGQGSFTGGNGITITGTSIAIDTSVTVDKTTVQTLTNKTLTSPTLVTPVLGTPSSGNLSSCTSYPVAQLTGTGTGVLTFLATPSSANLAAAITDETGSGPLVFATNPTITKPIIYTGSQVALTGSVAANIQTSGTNLDGGGFLSVNFFGNDANGPRTDYLKSRNTTPGSHTIVQNGDFTGFFIFNGDDGTNYVPNAYFSAAVDGTPGTGSMPGRIEVWTTPSGSASPRVIATFGQIGVTSLFKGANVASATAIVPTGNVFHVTGTTNITSITSTGIVAGASITIIFDGVLTFTDGNNLKLAGNFVTTADDTISLSYDGTNWYEMCRSVN